MQREHCLYNRHCLTHTIVSINWAVTNFVCVNSEIGSTPCSGRKTRFCKSISWWNCGQTCSPVWCHVALYIFNGLLLYKYFFEFQCARTRTGDVPHDAGTDPTLYRLSTNHFKFHIMLWRTGTPLKLFTNSFKTWYSKIFNILKVKYIYK